MRTTERKVIGWREWIGLPELHVERIKVKVDTGARSSALHASEVETFTREGRRMVRFEIHPIQRDMKITIRAVAPLFDERAVRSSSGRSELRPVIRTWVTFLDDRWPIELTLTRRDMMGFRMLLGREAVRGRFVVDPGRSFFGGRVKKKKSKVSKKKSAVQPPRRALRASNQSDCEE